MDVEVNGRLCDLSPIGYSAQSVFSEKKGLGWGMNVISSSKSGMASPQMKKNISDMARLGAEAAIFVPVWFQEGVRSEIIYSTSVSPSDESLREAVLYAKSLGLRVGIKPHVNMISGGSRSRIKPVNHDAWGRSYSQFISHYAYVAKEVGADIFFIGTELEGVTSGGRDDFWRGLISKVRGIYSGSLGYSSNRIGEAKSIKWWDDLDFIGVGFYDPLNYSSADGGEAALLSAWEKSGYLLSLTRLHERWGKPVVLGELGYYSRVDTAVNPAVISSGEISQSAQAMAYKVAFRVLASVPDLISVYLWALDASGVNEPGGFGFIPSNRKTMCELYNFSRQ